MESKAVYVEVDNDLCYICLQGGDLIKPCRCEKLTHKECIDRWRRYQLDSVPYPLVRNKYKNFKKCDICNAFYKDLPSVVKPTMPFWFRVFLDMLGVSVLLTVFYLLFGVILHFAGIRLRENDVENVVLLGIVTTHSLITLFYIVFGLFRSESDQPDCFCCWVGGAEFDCNDGGECCCIVLLFVIVIANFFIIFLDVYGKRRDQYKIYG